MSLKKPYFYKGNTLSKRFRGQVPRAQIQVCVSTKQSSWLRGGGNLWLLAFLLLPHFSSEMPIFIVRKGAVPEPAFRWTPNHPVFWRNAVPLAPVRHIYIYIYLSLSLFFLLSLLALFLYYFLVPCFFVLSCLVSLLLFHEKNQLKVFDWKVVRQSCLFLASCLVCIFQVLSSYICFLILSCVFAQHKRFDLPKKQLIKHQLLVKLGYNKTCFITCVLFKMWKVSPPILDTIMLTCKNTVKLVISALLKSKKRQYNYHFEGLLSGPSRGYDLGQAGVT